MVEHEVDYPVCPIDHRIFVVKGTTEALKQNGKELAEGFEGLVCAVGLGLFYTHSIESSLGTGYFHPGQVSMTKYKFQMPRDIQNVNVLWELDQQGVLSHNNFFNGRLCILIAIVVVFLHCVMPNQIEKDA